MTNTYPVFIVISSDNCCQKCANTYDGKIFSTKKDQDKKPPLHDDCNCSVAYFKTEEQALNASERIHNKRSDNPNATHKISKKSNWIKLK